MHIYVHTSLGACMHTHTLTLLWGWSFGFPGGGLVANIAGYSLLLSSLPITHSVSHWSKVLQSLFLVLAVYALYKEVTKYNGQKGSIGLKVKGQPITSSLSWQYVSCTSK